METLAERNSINSLSIDWLKKFSKRREEPSWVLDLRIKALEKFQACPWPSPHSPEWKRLNLKSLGIEKLGFIPTRMDYLETADLLTKELNRLLNAASSDHKNAPQFYLNTSRGYRRDLPTSMRKEGLEWITLEKAMEFHPEEIKRAWDKAIDLSKNNKFEILNLAVGNGGYCLIVPEGKKVEVPLYQFLSGGHAGGSQFTLNFYLIGKRAEVQLWEESASPQKAGSKEFLKSDAFISTMTSVYLDDDSHLDYFYLQHWDSKTINFQFQNIEQKRNTRLNTVTIGVGGKSVRHEMKIHLSGVGAENKVLGILFGGKNQGFESWITQNHKSPQTTSDIQYRGVLQGKAYSFFSGMVSIVKEAQRSDAYQSFKGLLLSKEARAEAIPNLEILADDVKCSHGAAVGPVDEDQKYYFQTRGVPPDLAEKTIILGFFEPVISAVPSEEVQDKLRTFIEEKISKNE